MKLKWKGNDAYLGSVRVGWIEYNCIDARATGMEAVCGCLLPGVVWVDGKPTGRTSKHRTNADAKAYVERVVEAWFKAVGEQTLKQALVAVMAKEVREWKAR